MGARSLLRAPGIGIPSIFAEVARSRQREGSADPAVTLGNDDGQCDTAQWHIRLR